LFNQRYCNRYLCGLYGPQYFPNSKKLFSFWFYTYAINNYYSTFKFYFHDNLSFTHHIISIEQYKVGWLTLVVFVIPSVVSIEKNESSIDKTVYVCIVYVHLLLSKNQSAVNVRKRSRDEEHCDYLHTVSFSGRKSTIIALHL